MHPSFAMENSLNIRYLDTLLCLGKKGEMFQPIPTSTIALSKELGLSQQTVSRDLIAMEKAGMISRTITKKGMDIRITREGYLSLSSLSSDILSILSPGALEMEGRIVSGLGEGGYYVGLKGYRDQFKRILGFLPFPGTLNLQVEPLLMERFLWGLTKDTLEGFTHAGRTFGKLDLYKINLGIGGKEHPSAIIIPKRTTHPAGICEVVAEENMRERYSLKDGSPVRIARR